MVVRRTLVAVVDDDESVREWLPDLLAELGFEAKAFASAEEFLATGCLADAGCLVLDIGLPGLSGPELQEELVRRGYRLPVIFITARGKDSIPAGLRQRAVPCLFKPFSDQELRAALDAALPRS